MSCVIFIVPCRVACRRGRLSSFKHLASSTLPRPGAYDALRVSLNSTSFVTTVVMQHCSTYRTVNKATAIPMSSSQIPRPLYCVAMAKVGQAELSSLSRLNAAYVVRYQARYVPLYVHGQRTARGRPVRCCQTIRGGSGTTGMSMPLPSATPRVTHSRICPNAQAESPT